MAKRFDQYCPIAHALSLVGERWALLVVRELMRGPKRYTDLANGLPGIGTNILAGRLRDLEEAGVVEKRKLPPPYGVTVYDLTPYVRELDEVMHALARWGARSLGLPSHDEDLPSDWGLNAFRALFYPERALGLTATWVLRVEDDVFTVRLDEGHLQTQLGATADADADLAMDMRTFYELASGDVPLAEPLADGRVRVDGDAGVAARFFDVFNFAPRLDVRAGEADRLGARVAPAGAAAG
jgi:DNA-binding HxlR family transcriptional regulator